MDMDEMLTARVDDLLHSRERPPILFTSGTQAAIDSLIERMAVVEEAIRTLAAEVESLSATR